MKRDLSKFHGATFDLLIVGGGIVGSGIAWDASLRGLSCALIEQGEFASGTSSKTTKLIHGGLRYLEQLDFGLVRESLKERQTLFRIAPQLVRPLPFLIPVRGRNPRPWPLVRFGIALYDWLAGPPPKQRHRFLRGNEAEKAEPALQGGKVERAAVYTDGQMDDAGLVLAVMEAAERSGAVLANHVCVVGWRMEQGRVQGAEVQDAQGGGRFSIRARQVVNATGPWADRLRRLADPNAPAIVRPSKGIHLVYPSLGLRHALVLSSQRDGRIFFLIPWKGQTLIGTTDTDYEGDPGRAEATPEEVEYLIEGTNRCLPSLNIRRDKVISTFAGVRPLVAREGKDPWAISRRHLIHEDPNGLVSVVGGKFTTFRKIAEEVVDRLAARFPDRKLALCRTAREKLVVDKSK